MLLKFLEQLSDWCAYGLHEKSLPWGYNLGVGHKQVSRWPQGILTSKEHGPPQGQDSGHRKEQESSEQRTCLALELLSWGAVFWKGDPRKHALTRALEVGDEMETGNLEKARPYMTGRLDWTWCWVLGTWLILSSTFLTIVWVEFTAWARGGGAKPAGVGRRDSGQAQCTLFLCS